MYKHWILVLFSIIMLQSCVEVANEFSLIPPGKWRATLNLKGQSATDIIITDNETERVFSELTDGELPFNFAVEYKNDTSFIIKILNDEEEIIVDDIYYGRDPSTNHDSIRINFPVFDSYVTGLYEEDKIQGFWIVNYKENYKIPFNAVFGQSHRFTNLKREPKSDISGKWEVTFATGAENEFKGIGEFEQEGNHLSGTFRTETGDFRFLEGTVQGDKAYLSCFDGSHAFLFIAKILEDGSLTGSFRSGKHYLTTWKAEKNDSFELRDPNNLTFVEGQQPFYFEFENLNGETVSLNDSQFDDKIVIVSILGTWCPNCRDEIDFLKSYFENNPNEHIELVGIAFERYREKEKSLAAIQRYKDKMDLDFEILYGGYFDKAEAKEGFPMLNKIISYPTMIIIDQNKNVRRIHTGFSGPATSKFESFRIDFDELIKELVNEQES